jgi:hypothetical protein
VRAPGAILQAILQVMPQGGPVCYAPKVLKGDVSARCYTYKAFCFRAFGSWILVPVVLVLGVLVLGVAGIGSPGSSGLGSRSPRSSLRLPRLPRGLSRVMAGWVFQGCSWAGLCRWLRIYF